MSKELRLSGHVFEEDMSPEMLIEMKKSILRGLSE